MSTDPFDRYSDEPSYFLSDESEEASLKRVDNRIHDLTSKGARWHPLRWISMAAMVLIVVIAGRYWMSGDSNGASLASSYFEAYPNYQTIATRGAENTSQLRAAYQAYDDKKYEISANEFKTQPVLSAVDGLYYAIVLQSLSEWDVSLRMLFRIRTELPEEYSAAGDWYLALALVAMERSQEAIPILENIAATQSVFTINAADLLKKI